MFTITLFNSNCLSSLLLPIIYKETGSPLKRHSLLYLPVHRFYRKRKKVYIYNLQLAPHNGVNIFHLDACSIKKKHNGIGLRFSDLNVSFDIIILSEIWYNEFSDNCLNLNCTHYALNHEDRRGG